VRGATATGLLRFVLFEELPRFFEGEGVSVDDQLVFAGVFRTMRSMSTMRESLQQQVFTEIHRNCI